MRIIVYKFSGLQTTEQATMNHLQYTLYSYFFYAYISFVIILVVYCEYTGIQVLGYEHQAKIQTALSQQSPARIPHTPWHWHICTTSTSHFAPRIIICITTFIPTVHTSTYHTPAVRPVMRGGGLTSSSAS